MSLLTRITRSGRANEKLDVMPYFDYLLNHVDGIRAPLRSYRKFLENSHISILKMSHTEKLERGSEACPLSALIAIQQQFCDIQIKFAEEVGTFIRLLKEWENLCELIMKLKSDLQKACTAKERDKLRASDAYKLSESAYQIQRDELYKMLTRYFSTEMENQKKTKEFQTRLSSFLTSCRDLVDQGSANGQPTSSLTFTGRVFGASLAGHLDAEGYSTVLRSILSYLTNSKAYTREGIFRVPGQVSSIHLLKDAFERGMADEELFESCGVFEVADLMKQYLRDLPEPILPTDLLTNWPTETPNVDTVKSLINQHVVEPNRRNLFLLLKFLSEVAENQNSSKMTPENLTITLWKSFRSNSDPFVVPRIVQYLITNAKALIEGEKEPFLLHLQSAQSRREKCLRLLGRAAVVEVPSITSLWKEFENFDALPLSLLAANLLIHCAKEGKIISPSDSKWKEGGRSKPPPPPRPNPPTQAHSYSPQVSVNEVPASSVERQLSSPKLVTNFNGPDGRPKSAIHFESGRATPEICQRTMELSASMEQWKTSATKEQAFDTTRTEENLEQPKKKDEPKDKSGSEGSEESDGEVSVDNSTTTSTSSAEEEEEEKKKHNHKKSPKTRTEKSKGTKARKKNEEVKFDQELEDKKKSVTSEGHEASGSEMKSTSRSDEGTKEPSAASNPPRPASSVEKKS